MKNTNQKLSVLAGAVLCGLFAGSAHAVASYGTLNTAAFAGRSNADYADGVYHGGGILNDPNWTINTVNNIEVALRAKNRDTFDGDGSSGVYQFSYGLCNPGCSGATKAKWNYEFSVNTRADGTGTSDLSNKFVAIRVDTNAGAGTSFTSWLDVTSNWGDNAYWDGAGPDERRIGAGPALAGEFGLQQSVNPLFSNSGFQPGFNPYSPGLYEIEFAVFDADPNGTSQFNMLAGTAITVSVPEPGSMALVGIGLAVAGFMRRRNKPVAV